MRVLVIDPPDRKQLDELGYTLSRRSIRSSCPSIASCRRWSWSTACRCRRASRACRRASFAVRSSKAAPARRRRRPHQRRWLRRSDRIVTDLPLANPREAAAPLHARDHEETPRLTTPEAAPPSRIARRARRALVHHAAAPRARHRSIGIGPPAAVPAGPQATEPLPIAEAVRLIDEAVDRRRDPQLALSRRAIAARYVALSSCTPTPAGPLALADAWIDRDSSPRSRSRSRQRRPSARRLPHARPSSAASVKMRTAPRSSRARSLDAAPGRAPPGRVARSHRRAPLRRRQWSRASQRGAGRAVERDRGGRARLPATHPLGQGPGLSQRHLEQRRQGRRRTPLGEGRRESLASAHAGAWSARRRRRRGPAA